MTAQTSQDGGEMVALAAVTAREAPVALAPTTLALGPGAHALVGTRDDGVGLALATIAGRVRARSGVLRVLGGAPGDRRVRTAVAHVGREVALPEVMRVAEVMDVAARVRGEAPADATARLDRLGIGALATRKVRTLLPSEARAVALAEAVTSAAQVLLLEEPFADVDARAASHLTAVLRARAAAGACVVVATASLREAAELADDLLLFERGRFVHRASALADVARTGAGPARLRAVVADPRTLLAALAAETAPDAIEADARSVTVAGPDVVALADAVARAALRANVEITSLRAEAPPLEELRASLAGDAAAAYRAAMERRAAPPTNPNVPAAPNAPTAPPPSGPPSSLPQPPPQSSGGGAP